MAFLFQARDCFLARIGEFYPVAAHLKDFGHALRVITVIVDHEYVFWHGSLALFDSDNWTETVPSGSNGARRLEIG